MNTKFILLLILSFLLSFSCSTPKPNDLKSKVNSMVSEYNAIDNWEYSLTNGAIREWTTIQANKLEKLWLTNNPILYYGHIMETTDYDASHYILLIERNTLINFKYFYYPGVRLSLIIPKIKFDTFLEKHPDFYGEFGFNNSIALIADIDSISLMTELDENGDDYSILLGHGTLLDILYNGFVAL